MAVLETIIQQLEEALEATPEDHPDRAGRLHRLGVGYHNRYQRTGGEADLEEAIRQFEEALKATPDDDPDRVDRLDSLGAGYRERYLRTGVETDLKKAIQQFEETLEGTLEDHPDRAGRLYNLGAGYFDKYQRTGGEADLKEAIQQFEEALKATPDDHPDKAGRLYSLGIGYGNRYRRTGIVADLENAIQQLEEALEGTPEDHPDRARRLDSLGIGYGDRYQRTGVVVDLEKAIRQSEEALKATPENHAGRARRLDSLGVGYVDRYQSIGAVADLEKAIQQFEEALKATPENHADRVRRLHSLGAGYYTRYQRTGAVADLENAIQQLEEALEGTPEDHPDRARRLDSLGIGYGDRYQRTGIMADLEEAIQQFEEALKATPDDHPDRASRLHSLGIGYHNRYQRTGAEADLKKAIQQLEEAFSHSSCPIRDRLRPSRDLLILYNTAEHWLLAYQVASTAVSLIPLLTPQSLDHSDKQHLLTEVSGLASEAAAFALMAKRSPYEAIRLLELGRGVIVGSLNDMRADISDLQDKYPLLAHEFIKQRDQLDAPARQISQSTVVPHQVNQRYDAGQKLERLLKDIRDLPGFSRFLLAPSETEIMAAAASGPIVVINVSDHRCDALIVETSELRTLRLSQLYSSDIRSRAAELTNPESLSTQLLEWLWDTIAKPILDVLGLTNSTGSRWPRIWWIPTGPLARFPIHAAGYHSRGSDTVLDRVISSYSSSIRGLIQGRQNRDKRNAAPKPGKAVLVGMEELRYAPQEINKLEGLCDSMHLLVCKPQPCRSDVLAALDDCNIFHFAGHGVTDAKDPSNSYLKLYDGPLTVKSLFGINLHNRKPFLAYLSACGTGQIAHAELIDEGLHLVAACQLAGFQHVIGTLWRVNDEFCIDVAAITYDWMQKEGRSDESVSEGLHHASRTLRSKWVSENAARAGKRGTEVRKVDQMAMEQSRSSQGEAREPRDVVSCDDIPLYWVPYVHFGV